MVLTCMGRWPIAGIHAGRLSPRAGVTAVLGRRGRCRAQAAHLQMESALLAPVLLDNVTGPVMLEGVSTLVLDCDGVLWRGTELVHNVPQALASLRLQGKRLLFVTNNSSKSRQQYVAKFKGLGIQAHASEVVSSSYAAAAYLQSVGFAASGKKVLLLGSEGVAQELQLAGIPYTCIDDLPVFDTVEAMRDMQLDPDIGAVVVAWDPTFSYSKLVYASACLRELHIPDALFVATNLDHADNIGNGRRMPGTGGIVAAVEVASGRRAVNVGKGGEWLFPFLLSAFADLQPGACCVVGDRLDTDIALGRQGGMLTVLPYATGVTTLEEALAAPAPAAPHYLVPTFTTLAGMGP